MSHTALLASYANPMRVVDSADFDGTNDYMTRGAGLTGAADSKSGIVSAWVRLDAAGDGLVLALASNGSAAATRFQVLRSAGNMFQVSGLNSGGGTILNLLSTTSYVGGGTWRHLLVSWDLATSAEHMYVNDVSDLTVSLSTDDTIDHTTSDFAIGAHTNALNKFDGCLAEFYFAPGQYLDFALVHNRRKFISASGKPVHLGSDGSLPTGTAPLVYLHLDDAEAVANFATNRGTGGNFSITGTLATGSTSPSD